MPDLWQECTCDDTLRCSLEDYKQLERKLEASAELSGHGFEIGGNHIEGIMRSGCWPNAWARPTTWARIS